MKEGKDWREGKGKGKGKSGRTKQCTGMWRVNCSGIAGGTSWYHQLVLDDWFGKSVLRWQVLSKLVRLM